MEIFIAILLILSFLSGFAINKYRDSTTINNSIIPFENKHLTINPYGFILEYINNLKLIETIPECNLKIFPVATPNEHYFTYLSFVSSIDPIAVLASYSSTTEDIKEYLNDKNIKFIEPSICSDLNKSIIDIFLSKHFEPSSFIYISFGLDEKIITMIYSLGKHQLIKNSYAILIQIDDMQSNL